jgi:hypothetical protein
VPIWLHFVPWHLLLWLSVPAGAAALAWALAPEAALANAVVPATSSVVQSTTPVVPPVVTPPAPSISTGALPTGIDTPDERGFVILTGVTNSRGKARCSIGEVGAALTGEQHASVQLNTGFLANGRWETDGFVGVCAEVEAVTDGTSGAKTYRLTRPQVPIPGTMAFPPQFTVASATAFLNSLGEPVAGSGAGFSPKVKG